MDSSSLFFINLTAVVIRKGDLECCVLWCWLLTGAGGEMYFMNIVTESFSAWLPVCSVLNSAKLLRRAPASARYRSPAYLFRRGRSRCAKVNPITHVQWKLGVTHLYLEETCSVSFWIELVIIPHFSNISLGCFFFLPLTVLFPLFFHYFAIHAWSHVHISAYINNRIKHFVQQKCSYQ